MIKQGIKINSWEKNVFVKVPVINSKKEFTGKVIKELNKKILNLILHQFTQQIRLKKF